MSGRKLLPLLLAMGIVPLPRHPVQDTPANPEIVERLKKAAENKRARKRAKHQPGEMQ